MSQRITRKRARLEAEAELEGTGPDGAVVADDELAGLKRDEELWQEDGNIILVAGGTAFKVYRGPLCDHSPVFKDMFSLPQPEPTLPASSCPLVHLTDSPTDLRCVLLALMPSKRVCMVQNYLTYHDVSAYIRLGHKYQMDAFVKECVAYLRTLYPDDYETWKTAKPFLPPYAIGVINLARLAGADILLPAAFLECCRLGPDVADGLRNPDGTVEYLSPRDLKIYIRAQRELTKARVQIALRVFNTGPAPDCNHADLDDLNSEDETDSETDAEEGNDSVILECFFEDLKKGKINRLYTPNPFMTNFVSLMKRHTPGLCTACEKMLKDRLLQEQRATFKHLPELVGIRVDGWGQRTPPSRPR